MSEPPHMPESAPPEAPAPETAQAPLHLYDAAATQREKVLDGFSQQREAIMRAVADQRAAALAPIDAVNARRLGGAAPPQGGQRQLVAAEIAAAVKALVAAEVRSQLAELLEPKTVRRD